MEDLLPCFCPTSLHFASPALLTLSISLASLFGVLWFLAVAASIASSWTSLLDCNLCFRLLCRCQRESLEPKALKILSQRMLERHEAFNRLIARIMLPIVLLNSLLYSVPFLMHNVDYPRGSFFLDLIVVFFAGVHHIIFIIRRWVPVPAPVYKALHAAAFVAFTVCPLAADTEQLSYDLSRTGQMFTLALSLTILDGRQIVLLNLLSFVFLILVMIFSPTLSGSGNNSFLWLFCWLSPALNCGVSFSIRESMMLEAAATFRERQASRSEEVVQSLLSVMCDAVVALKPDLTLRDSCPRLASLLLRPALGQPTSTDRNILQYVAEGDAPKLEDFLKKPAMEESSRSIHIHLLDLMGNRVRVQIFHSRMLDIDNCAYHLLGLVEDTKQETGELGLPALRLQPEAREDSSSESGIESPRRAGDTGLSSWGHIGKLVLRIRTQMTFEIIEESEASRVFFNFASDGSPASFAERFLEPCRLVQWLEHNHVMATHGVRQHQGLFFGKVKIWNPASGTVYVGSMNATVVCVPESRGASRDLEQQSVVDFEVHISAPRISRRGSRPSRLGARLEGPLTDSANSPVHL